MGVVDVHRQYKQKAVQLPRNDTLTGFTDGVTEARSAEGEFLGLAAIVALGTRNVEKSADEQAHCISKPSSDIAPKARMTTA